VTVRMGEATKSRDFKGEEQVEHGDQLDRDNKKQIEAENDAKKTQKCKFIITCQSWHSPSGWTVCYMCTCVYVHTCLNAHVCCFPVTPLGRSISSVTL
jgi:hypothetical protein